MTNPIIEIRIKGMGTMTAELYPAVAPKTVANFVKLAEAFGAVGMRAMNIDEFETAFKKAIEINGPVVIDTYIYKDEFVLPMRPPGGSVDDIITEIND